MENIGFYFDPQNAPMGDLISITSIPENVYKTCGAKLIDMFNLWVFDHNPYVQRGVEPETVIYFAEDLGKHAVERCDLISSPYPPSTSWIYCRTWDMKLFLRHPRLYKFEGNIPDGNSIAIHTTPRGFDPTRQSHISKEILERIYSTYYDYKIFQVGGRDDFKIESPNLIDKTGLSFWDTAEIISKCGTFIGTNSGHTQLANCFPRTRKKVILSMGEYLPGMFPQCQAKGNYGNWIDFNWEYYNNTPIDIGVTMSYLKI